MTQLLIAATLSPFDFIGRVDLAHLKQHIEWLTENGIQGFAPTGTTGEFLYLNWDERRAIHQTVLQAAGTSLVIPCVWDTEPHRAIALAEHAADEGAKAVFLPPPIYHRVREDGVLRWYENIVEHSPIPVWAYHHPRTHNPISSELYGKLRSVGIQGLKDSSGEPTRVHALCHAYPGEIWIGGAAMIPRLEVLSGAAGHVSRLANLYPRLTRRVAEEGLGTDANRLLQIEHQIRTLGGLTVVKKKLGMGCRLPVLPPPGLDLTSLPDPGFPGPATEYI